VRNAGTTSSCSYGTSRENPDQKGSKVIRAQKVHKAQQVLKALRVQWALKVRRVQKALQVLA
jgi:hypothetical protein